MEGEVENLSPFGINLTKRFVSGGAEALLYKPHDVRKAGVVELVDYMGGDATVERVATAGHGRRIFPENPDPHDFTDYLAKRGILEPFTSVQLKFLVESPIETALALVYEPRASVNEYSGRYSVMMDGSFTPSHGMIAIPLLQGENSLDADDRTRRISDALNVGRDEVFHRYKELIDMDLARELARTGLGTDNYTKYFWKIDLLSLFGFVERQRAYHGNKVADPTVDFVECLEEIASEVAPLSWGALTRRHSGRPIKLTMPRDEEVVDGPLSPPGWEPQKTRRVVVPDLEEVLFVASPILEHGAVQAVDYMGEDSSFAQAARTSYGEGTTTLQDDRNLIRSLIRDLHTSPIEMCELAVEGKTPVFIDPRQAGRHRTLDDHGFMGYTPKGSQFYMPPESELKYQDRLDRQGRGKDMEADEKVRVQTLLRESFQIEQDNAVLLRELDSPEEFVRAQRGVGFFTKRWRTGDTHNWGHFLMLRGDPQAQKEVRDYAGAVDTLHRAHTPIANEALHTYIINGMRLSEKEISLLKSMLREGIDPESLDTYKGVGFVIPKRDENREVIVEDGEKVMQLGREGKSFKGKLLRLLG